MIKKLVAKLDKKGSEVATHNHYTFGTRKDVIAGGFYIDKRIKEIPANIEIEIKEEKDDR